MKIKTLPLRVAPAALTRTPREVNSESWRGLAQTSHERGYGHAWRKARARYLKEHPLCAYCQRMGRVTAATVLDHITPHRGDQRLFWDVHNWQPLCATCHNSTKQHEEKRQAEGVGLAARVTRAG